MQWKLWPSPGMWVGLATDATAGRNGNVKGEILGDAFGVHDFVGGL